MKFTIDRCIGARGPGRLRAPASAPSDENAYGVGKTTTAGMLTTRVVPTSGRAFLAGVDVAAQPALAKQLSGIVSQQNTLDRQLTVWENPYFHGRLFGIGAKEFRQTADELLARFQLSKWANASVYALSGGRPSGSWWRGRSSTGPPCFS